MWAGSEERRCGRGEYVEQGLAITLNKSSKLGDRRGKEELVTRSKQWCGCGLGVGLFHAWNILPFLPLDHNLTFPFPPLFSATLPVDCQPTPTALPSCLLYVSKMKCSGIEYMNLISTSKFARGLTFNSSIPQSCFSFSNIHPNSLPPTWLLPCFLTLLCLVMTSYPYLYFCFLSRKRGIESGRREGERWWSGRKKYLKQIPCRIYLVSIFNVSLI